MEVKTRFNIGDTIWHINQCDVFNCKCEHCGRIDYSNPSGTSYDVECSDVNLIDIQVDYLEVEIEYTLKNRTPVSEACAFATPEEAHESIKKDKE